MASILYSDMSFRQDISNVEIVAAFLGGPIVKQTFWNVWQRSGRITLSVLVKEMTGHSGAILVIHEGNNPPLVEVRLFHS